MYKWKVQQRGWAWVNSKGNCNGIFLNVTHAAAPRTAAKSRVPLEPHRAIIRGLLLLSSSLRQALPARSLMTDSSFKMRAWKREEGDRKEITILPSLFPHTARIANPLLPSLIGFRFSDECQYKSAALNLNQKHPIYISPNSRNGGL